MIYKGSKVLPKCTLSVTYIKPDLTSSSCF